MGVRIIFPVTLAQCWTNNFGNNFFTLHLDMILTWSYGSMSLAAGGDVMRPRQPDGFFRPAMQAR